MNLWSMRRMFAMTACLFLAASLWDATALDLPLARLAGGPAGFAWRSDALFVLWLHEVPRWLSSAALLALACGVKWPWGPLRRLAAADRLQLVVAILAAMAAVTVLKRMSASSCPWDLAEFGGVARYVSHWNWVARDEGGGHCFPGGHASAAFAYVAAWFVLRRTAPSVARWWLVGALAAGVVLGVAQQARGAHYMSHTFWSAWFCFVTGLVVEWGFAAVRRRSGESLHRGLGVSADTKLNET